MSSPGSAWSIAATVMPPSADAPSGLIAPAPGSLCSAIVNGGVPPTMYFRNGVPVPALRRIAMPIFTVPLIVMDTNSEGRPVARLSESTVNA